ncbi:MULTISPECIES: hypothetical protein [Metabacillus]|uniref:Uncharacterized protein n=1 Tax=Metabacillus rhizolycopersici TaxID=2875709 RepID=A0ABS7UWV2_9BACI|nr:MULTISPECIES: hypothetical protein [Metabacillus]MBZ5752410.1 hypothetical protein [Metabacillus rhizolycopersici]MCM3654666.1 hypothetical protein [Metabacillus litoralis]
MNSKVKKVLFWSAITTPMVFGVYFLLGGYSALAAGPHGHGPREMGLRGDFGGHHMMYSHHHGGGFSWWGLLLFLIIGIAVLVLFVKWLRKKAKATSMQQFIDTSIMNSHKPMMNQNESILDQWEKNIVNKKENL